MLLIWRILSLPCPKNKLYNSIHMSQSLALDVLYVPMTYFLQLTNYSSIVYLLLFMFLDVTSSELSWALMSKNTVQTSVRRHFCFFFSFFFSTNDGLLETLLGQHEYSEICYERLIDHCKNLIVFFFFYGECSEVYFTHFLIH